METEKGWGWAGQCGPHLTHLGGGEVAGSNLPSCDWLPRSSLAVAR